MIYAIDHVALACSDAPSACAQVSLWGYTKVFSAMGVSNPLIKKPLMKDWCDKHDLFYFQKKGAFNIEVIRYDSTHEGGSFLDAKPLGESIELFAKDLEAGYGFWSLLGLKLVRKEPDHYRCSFCTPFSPEVSFIISRRLSNDGNNALDTAGFNCIAFVSTSLQQDRKSLLDSGVKTTRIENVQINDKKLSIFFAEGDSGEKVEIIGFKERLNA